MGELNTKMTALADAIRAKTGGTTKLTLDQMPTEIANISTGENLDTVLDTQENIIEEIKELLATKVNSEEAYYWDQLCRERISYCTFPYNQRIKAGLFMNCYYIEWLDAPEATGFAEYACTKCSKLTNINAPKAKYVGNYAFNTCKTLPRVSLPVCSVVSAQGFMSCSALSEVYLPQVLSIGDRGFSACTALKEIDLPLCTYISASAFAGCTSLSRINMPALSSTFTYCFNGCTALPSVELPMTTFIGKYVFQSCTSLSVASLPKATTLDQYAFNGCTNLKSLYLMGSSMCNLANVNVFNGTPLSAGGTGKIYVPASLYNSYYTGTNWASIKARLVSVAT